MTSNVVVQKKFCNRIFEMEGVKEYAEEGTPLNEQSNCRKEPIKDDITNNYS